jgi:hypothetical protein
MIFLKVSYFLLQLCLSFQTCLLILLQLFIEIESEIFFRCIIPSKEKRVYNTIINESR